MARRAALTLDNLETTRGAAAADAVARRPKLPDASRTPVTGAASKRDTRRGQTLRLEPEAWKQLKQLGVEKSKPVHELLIEAVNLLFDHYQLPMIAG